MITKLVIFTQNLTIADIQPYNEQMLTWAGSLWRSPTWCQEFLDAFCRSRLWTWPLLDCPAGKTINPGTYSHWLTPQYYLSHTCIDNQWGRWIISFRCTHGFIQIPQVSVQDVSTWPTSMNGSFPVAISITVQPSDQMSAYKYQNKTVSTQITFCVNVC